MSPPVFCRGRLMGKPSGGTLSRREVLRPTWDVSSNAWRGMEVDHQLEMQVSPIGGEASFDQRWNYWLLDADSNGQAGNMMKIFIQAERRDVNTRFPGQGWLTKDITRFHRLDVEGGAWHRGFWHFDQGRDGEHLDNFESAWGGIPGNPTQIARCVSRGGRMG